MTTKSERALEDWRAGECDLRTALEALATDDEIGTNIRLAVGAALEQGIPAAPKFRPGQRVTIRSRNTVGVIAEVNTVSDETMYRIPVATGTQWYGERDLQWAAPTLTVGELIVALGKHPRTRYVIGFGDKTDYVNIGGVSDPGDPDDALVIEFSEDYDSRQW